MKIKEAGMTIKECYEKVGSDYDGVLKRLGSTCEKICSKIS